MFHTAMVQEQMSEPIRHPLAAVASIAHGSRVQVGAQNLYPKDEGAFTGEVSAPMLLEAGHEAGQVDGRG